MIHSRSQSATASVLRIIFTKANRLLRQVEFLDNQIGFLRQRADSPNSVITKTIRKRYILPVADDTGNIIDAVRALTLTALRCSKPSPALIPVNPNGTGSAGCPWGQSAAGSAHG